MAEVLTKLTSSDITIGTPLPWPVYDSNGASLVKQGFVIKSSAQVNRLIARGAYTRKSAAPTQSAPALNEFNAESLEVISPFRLLEDVISHLAITLACSEHKEINFTQEVMALVKDVQRACNFDAHASIASLFVLEGGSYPIKHSVDVAVLCEILAKKLSTTIKQRQSIVAAALTMNIAMIELQEKLFRQEAPLTVDQQQAIHDHPKQGAAMLRKAGVADPLWLELVASHHETITGTGYPSKLLGSEYPKTAQMIALADQYCARISPRAYRDPLLHKGILRDLLLDNGHSVEPDIAAHFIKELGFYPPGLIVQLVNTEVGVVTKRGDKVDTPIVHVCMKPDVGNYQQHVMRNTAMANYKIHKVLQSNDPFVTFDRRSVWRFNEDKPATKKASHSSPLSTEQIENNTSELNNEIDQLPLLPSAIAEIMALSLADEHYFSKVQRLAEQDPTFAVRLIKLANSAAHASASKITSIQQAVTKIGTRQIKGLVTSFAVAQIFVPTNKSERDLWVHSIQVAVASRAIARLAADLQIDPEHAYLCGLLHDIGRFILFKKIPDGPARIDEQDWENPEQLIIAEQDVCGMNHAELGEFAAKKWALPDEVSQAIGEHHNYTYSMKKQPDKKMASLLKTVQMADYLSVLLMKTPDTLLLSPGKLEAKLAEKCTHASWTTLPVTPKLLQKEVVGIYEQAADIINNLGICAEE